MPRKSLTVVNRVKVAFHNFAWVIEVDLWQADDSFQHGVFAGGAARAVDVVPMREVIPVITSRQSASSSTSRPQRLKHRVIDRNWFNGACCCRHRGCGVDAASSWL